MAYENTEIMYHQLSCKMPYNKQATIEETSEQLKRNQTALDNIVLKNTKITKAKLKEINEKKKDWYMDVKEALDLGVIDEIMIPEKK